MSYDVNLAPFGWYIGSYLCRFIELEADNNCDPETRFLSWENTVIVQAANLGEAYEKIDAIGIDHSYPYQGGPRAIPVKWEYLGITELLPIYDELEDGSEVMWAEHHPRKLKNLKRMVVSKGALLSRKAKD
ncbi:MAG: DUF4288 domain-containing protein [Cyanobacteria bacterium P01_H01_bin.130]